MVDSLEALLVAGGAFIGGVAAPGFGGVVGGSIAGLLVDKLLRKATTAKRVFVSFDFDNDRALKEFIIGQSKLPSSPFSVVDCSLKEAAPMKTWEQAARRAIRNADLVLVMVGEHTHKASGVLKEVGMAREEDIQIVQMIGYRERNYTAVRGAGRLYNWNWNNLKTLLA